MIQTIKYEALLANIHKYHVEYLSSFVWYEVYLSMLMVGVVAFPGYLPLYHHAVSTLPTTSALV